MTTVAVEELFVTPERRNEVVLELIDGHDQKHDQAHKRLRDDFRELDFKVADAIKALHAKVEATEDVVVKLANTPVDITNVVMTPKIVASIVFVVVGIAGGMWASTSGLRAGIDRIDTQIKSDQRVADANAKNILTQMDADKRVAEVTAKMRELTDAQMKADINALKAEVRLSQITLGQLQEKLAGRR
jgi:hypothetical protein